MNARIERLKELLKQSPHDSFICFALAMEHKKLSQATEAIDLLVNLIEHDEDYVGAYYHLAALYYDEQQVEKALIIYDKGMLIAQKVGDQHAYSELKNAKMNIEIELD